MRYRILGPLEVLDDEGRPVPLGGRRERHLLATLVLAANRVVSSDRLIDSLWGDHPPETAANALQVHVSKLRKMLVASPTVGGPLHTQAPGYVLRTSPGEVDSERFEELAASRPDDDDARLSSRLAEALALWRGPVLDGLEIDTSARSDVARLEELRIAVLVRRIEADLALGRHRAVVGELEALIDAHPLHEGLAGHLMLALYRSGRQADALGVYRRTRQVLAEELGIDPSPALRDLELAVLHQSPELQPSSGDGAVTVGAPRPSGTVTLLFTDIEGSTRLWERWPEMMASALQRHDVLLRSAIAGSGGYVFKTAGDAFRAAFSTAKEAVRAAVDAQRALSAEPWPTETPVRVRMALHAGECEERDGDYFGPPLNRVARLEAVAHGGQVILSRAAVDVVHDHLPPDTRLRVLGTHHLKDLSRPEEVSELLIEGLEADFPPLRSLDNPAMQNNLPELVSSFVGRDTEVVDVRHLVERHRLVTLAGPGGVGKTRLGLQVAAELLDGSGDGVWLVELATVSDPEAVPGALARALGIREQAGRPLLDVLVDALADQNLLFVLDNCEHLIGSSAKVAEAVLRHCPRVSLLATSREPLGIDGEQVFRVPSLSLPPDDVEAPSDLDGSGAVTLFMERARAQAGGFTQTGGFSLTDDTAVLVGAICRRLDGVPLALELAAARLRSMSLVHLHDRLDERFRVLTGGSRTALPRQQTLRALIDWSHDLLNGFERAVLRRLSVFVGGFELEAAEAVCGFGDVEDVDVADLLGSLVDKSLVQAEATGRTVRYRLLETIHQYATEKLLDDGPAEDHEAKSRHAEVFLALAEEARPQMTGPDQGRWLDRLDAERDNLRRALVHFAGAPADRAQVLRLSVALVLFWRSRGYYREGIDVLRVALSTSQATEPTSLRAAALEALGTLLFQRGDSTEALTIFEEGLALARTNHDVRVTAHLLCGICFVHFRQGDYSHAEELADEAVGLARTDGDDALVALTLGWRATIRAERPAEAIADLDAALTFFRKTGDRGHTLHVLNNLGTFELQDGNLPTARAHLEEARGIAAELQDNDALITILQNLGVVTLLERDTTSALRYASESLTLARRVNQRGWLPYIVLVFALCASAAVEHERAATLHGAADTLMDGLDESFEPLERALRAADHAHLRQAMGDEAFDVAYRSGLTMAPKDIVELTAALKASEVV
jgi:predicted ATPase/DNA-binding SARP family transcriptional activator